MSEWLRSETEVLVKIVSDTQSLANSIGFALDTAFPFPEHGFAQDVLVAINVPRQVLGLRPDRKPGDVDLLVIPFKNSVLVERAIAIEVKIVRPTINKPSRNVNSMGLQQARGLLEDGFPFVGLLHVAVPEPLPEKLHRRVPLKSWESDEDGELLDTGEFVLLDPFPLASARRQEGRLRALGLRVEVAFKSIGFGLSSDGERLEGCSVGAQRFGQRNPLVAPSLLDRLAELVEQEPARFRHVRWHED